MQVDCKTEIIFSSSAKHICCAWLLSAYSAIRSRVSSTAPAWRTALYLALYHYSFHYFFLDFSTTRGATSHSLHPSNIKIFQSTHPLRGETAGARWCGRCALHFNPRTPYGVRPAAHCSVRWLGTTFQSTHHPEEYDPQAPYFNPRTPYGVRRHAAGRHRHQAGDFNPRTPCGVRLCH